MAPDADVIFIYDQANDSSYEATRMYQERFLDSQWANPKRFAAVFRRLAETGSLIPNMRW